MIIIKYVVYDEYFVVYDYGVCGLWLQIHWFMITDSMVYDYRFTGL